MENRTHDSEVKGARAKHCATEATKKIWKSNIAIVLNHNDNFNMYVCMYTSLFKNVAIMELQQTCNFTMHINYKTTLFT